MKTLFQKVKWNMIAVAVITAAIGVALLLKPEAVPSAICKLLGWVLIIAGCISCITYVVGSNKKKKESEDGSMEPASDSLWSGRFTMLFLGVIELAFGIYVLLNTVLFINLLNIVFGVLLLLNGINDVIQAIRMRQMGSQRWADSLIIGIIGLVLAAVIIFNPFQTIKMLMRLVGVALLFDGMTDIYIAFRVGYVSKFFMENKVELKEEPVVVKEEPVAGDASMAPETPATPVAPTAPETPATPVVPTAPETPAPPQAPTSPGEAQ